MSQHRKLKVRMGVTVRFTRLTFGEPSESNVNLYADPLEGASVEDGSSESDQAEPRLFPSGGRDLSVTSLGQLGDNDSDSYEERQPEEQNENGLYPYEQLGETFEQELAGYGT